jgi:very-short-patch-repair endonuclease
VWIGNIGRVDLCERRLRIVVEADSFEFHSDATALNSDMVRYNAFVCEGYLVLRFGWIHAMFEPDYVLQAVTAVASAQERSVRLCPTCRAA